MDEITSRAEALRAAALQWLTHEIPLGVVVTDLELRVVAWNYWMERATGRTAEAAVGERLLDLFPDLVARKMARYYQLALTNHELVLAQRFHRYLLAIPLPSREDSQLMQQSARISPVVLNDEVIGTVTLIDDVTDRVEHDLELSAKIHELERAQKRLQASEQALRSSLDYERRLLKILAESFLGQVPDLPYLEVACRYQAALQSERFGGDYFDFINVAPDQLGIVIGDICGKGLRAGVYTAMAKYTLRALVHYGETPSRLMERMNRVLAGQMGLDQIFVTMVYVHLDLEKMTLSYVNAGHPSPVLCDRHGECHYLNTTGSLLGFLAETSYEHRTITVAPGDVLVFFTDGVIDVARGQDEIVMCELLKKYHLTESVESIAEAAMNEIVTPRGRELLDDVALVVVRFLGPGGAHGVEVGTVTRRAGLPQDESNLDVSCACDEPAEGVR